MIFFFSYVLACLLFRTGLHSWVIETFYGNTSVAKALQIGDFDARRKTITIDVDASRDNSNPKLMTDGKEDEPTRRS
jgi:hypothetical protein